MNDRLVPPPLILFYSSSNAATLSLKIQVLVAGFVRVRQSKTVRTPMPTPIPNDNRSLDELEEAYRRAGDDAQVIGEIRREVKRRDSKRAKLLLRDIDLTLGTQDSHFEELTDDLRGRMLSLDPRSPQARAAQVKIAELRQRLLDLSNRNRLINFKHSNRGGRQVRIVSEWLPKLIDVLETDKPVELVPLPPLPGTPDDESKPEFVSALDEALLTDKAYLKAVEKVDDEPEEKAEPLVAKAERALRDRVRKKLGWPTRAEALTLSVAEHAKRFGIDPSYDLSNATPRRGRRRVYQWQTLLSEDELERRLRALEHQARESREEYGVETLYLVAGFLEWREKTPTGESDTTNLSPILLIPVGIEKHQPERLSRMVDDTMLIEDGEERPNKHRDTYVITSGADEPTVNLCLRERLRQDFGIELPEWDEELGLEHFLRQVEASVADQEGWKVRSFATVSHLSFNRLAMWVDLDPEKDSVNPPHVHPVLGELFGGGVTHEAEDTRPEESETETGVPSLILDCDSSQFAAIKAALKGKNLTIQGPPGTGKSQTIANLIASLLHEGKTVLFVAEKMAALDVVHSRLTDAGIGDFLLELHSAKASKKAVLDSIRKRIARRKRSNDEVSASVARRRAALRDKLNGYASAINAPFGESGLTVHDIIWQGYEYRNKPVPDQLAGYRLAEVETWDRDAFETRAEVLEHHVDLEARYNDERCGEEHPWHWVENQTLHVEECNRLYQHVIDLRSKLCQLQDWLKEIDLATLPSSFLALQTLAGELRSIGSRPIETVAGQWDLARREDGLRLAELVKCAHERCVKAEAILQGIAPGAIGHGAEHLETLAAYAAKAMPGTRSTTDAARLATEREENTRLLAQLADAIVLMEQLATFLPWKGPVGEPELRAAAVYINLAAKVPGHITAKRNDTLPEWSTSQLREKIDQVEKCKARCDSLVGKLKISVGELDHATLVKHRDELSRSGVFAIFRASYREALKFCRNVCPTVPKLERLEFVSALCEIVAQRNKLSQDPTLQAAVSDQFAIWDKCLIPLVESCDWIDEVSRNTPILDRYAKALRSALFRVTLDEVSIAKKLVAEDWPKILESLAAQCQRQGVVLQDVRAAIINGQSNIDRVAEAMRGIDWQGTVSQDRIKAAAAANASHRDAQMTLSENAEVLRLLLPDPTRAESGIRAINAAQRRVQSLPLQPVWRDRLLKADSQSDWADFLGHVASLQSRLDEIEQLAGKLYTLAAIGTKQRDMWHRSSLELWSSVLLGAAQAERKLVTRAQLLASVAKVKSYDLEELIAGARDASMQHFDGIRDLLRCLYLRSCAFKAIGEHAALAEFKNSSPANVREKFSQLDQELKQLHRQELVQRLMQRQAPMGVSSGLIKERTEMGLLYHVASLEKPRTSVRDLLRRAGRAMQSLKPCFMMSPLSVAQLIERGKLSFDVVIFDEASQVRPEDAISAIARSRQFVVVGDQMQLPPTSFGERSFDEPLDADDGGEVEESAAVESILELANASYGQGSMLLWHYRSRDPALIAFSNKHFYDNELLLFPSPAAKSNATGVKYVWVGGHYSARTNAEEAKICAQAAIEFMRHSPDRSLGIVALNRPQADLIQLELDRLIHDNEDAARYQARWSNGLEPLFVKNLENVQGDERDTIFISTVFGDDESGNFYQRFGPINSVVGHRRLNVLFTRAKHQLVLFSSLPTEKIKPSETTHWGVRALKEYLDFARTGRLEQGIVTGKTEDSPFEVAVRRALESAGFTCEPQVGVAGFFVDLGVRHPRYPDHFMAGIECDGAAYHSSRSARDRDRLRQAVLESLGWHIFRIWSTDWFADPHAQLDKLIAHLQLLKATPIRSLGRHFDYAARFSKPRMQASARKEEGRNGDSPDATQQALEPGK